MKVLVVNNMAPFVWGGAEELATHLQKNLIIAGHEAEILRIPFQWEPATRIPSQMLMVRAFEVWNVDRSCDCAEISSLFDSTPQKDAVVASPVSPSLRFV